MRPASAATAAVVVLVAATAAIVVVSAGQPPAGDPQARFQTMSRDAESKGLAEPFKGVTADGEVVTGLFPTRSTGVSTEPVRQAADAFLAALSDDQRTKTMFALDDPEWRKWMNQHFYRRQGVSFEEMNASQREAAFGLLRAGLSARGLTLSRDIMKLNHTLGELNNDNFVEYGEWLYHLTVMGTPSATEPWGWQMDGHHLIVNYFVLGDQVVMTPTFVGSEPVTATSGKYKGTTILQEEQGKGLAFVNALNASQRSAAIVRASKDANDNLTEAFKDNVVIPFAGVKASTLSDAQRTQLTELIGLFVGYTRDGHAKVKMDEVKAHLGDTYFAWMGGTSPDSVFYYRIHSPVVLIEFDHQRPAGMRRLVDDPSKPMKEHVHVVIRTPNGNDYGKDLLRQHLAQHKHGEAHSH